MGVFVAKYLAKSEGGGHLIPSGCLKGVQRHLDLFANVLAIHLPCFGGSFELEDTIGGGDARNGVDILGFL